MTTNGTGTDYTGVPTLKVELSGDAARPPEPESGENDLEPPRVGERLALA